MIDPGYHHFVMLDGTRQDIELAGTWTHSRQIAEGDTIVIHAMLPSGHPIRLTSDPDAGAALTAWAIGRKRLDAQGALVTVRERQWRPGDPDGVNWSTCCQMIARLLAEAELALRAAEPSSSAPPNIPG